MIIENFAVLSPEEQLQFATSLLEKINSEKIFTDETAFKLQDITPNEVTGGLWIYADSVDSVGVCREASWTADTDEDAEEDPGFEATYDYFVTDDAKKAFKTLETTIDGYRVSLSIDDTDKNDKVKAEVKVMDIIDADAGIGDYEFWGFPGYDSRPYVEVTGTITRDYYLYVTLTVVPDDEN